jgi:hypothetical protein
LENDKAVSGLVSLMKANQKTFFEKQSVVQEPFVQTLLEEFKI